MQPEQASAPQITEVSTFACERCGTPLSAGTLVCPNCGALVYRARLEQLSAEALRLEPINPAAAAQVWQMALDLLPPDSQQYQAIYARIGALAAWPGFGGTIAGSPYGGAPARVRMPRPPDPPLVAVTKTVGSMLVSVIAYWLMFRQNDLPALWTLGASLGFVVLMLIHEMGHVFAMRYYGLSASPPIFIPFMGAIINLRQPPPNAKVEAIVGIAGPAAGTLGALGCFAAYLASPQGSAASNIFLLLSFLGFLLNLFNLLPVPPLDGGRITAAVSPWIWMPGLLALGWLIVDDLRHGHIPFVLLLIVFFALPRIRATLSRRGRDNPYYAISRQSQVMIGALYVVLAVTLLTLFLYARAHLPGNVLV